MAELQTKNLNRVGTDINQPGGGGVEQLQTITKNNRLYYCIPSPDNPFTCEEVSAMLGKFYTVQTEEDGVFEGHTYQIVGFVLGLEDYTPILFVQHYYISSDNVPTADMDIWHWEWLSGYQLLITENTQAN